MKSDAEIVEELKAEKIAVLKAKGMPTDKNYRYSTLKLWFDRCYGDGSNAVQWRLDYDSQLEFKRIAKRYFGLNADFYFDDVACVDGRTQKNIAGVKCDGKLQWGEAIDRLKQHFKAA